MKIKVLSATNVKGAVLLLALLCLSSAHGQSITNPIAQLKSHILGTTNLTAAQIVTQGNSIQTNINEVGTNAVALAAALDLVATYDTNEGALFTSGSPTYGGFTRDGVGDELAQALFDLQQGILDNAYTSANLTSNLTLLNGKKFGTSSYFPGAVTPPASTNTGYAVPINASVLADWGAPASYQTDATRRPTGCYLAPGSIGYVTVPAALVNSGYSIRVGAHHWDLAAKTMLKRLDRVSRVYSITSATTLIANPLGGGIYIQVPYKITNGIVTVGITNVVRSPLFRATSFDQTTAAEWLTERTQPGPWADFESDKFMMQVPRSWIYNYTNANTVMTNWDKAMDAVSDLMGRNHIRSKTVQYLQVDTDYRGTANFPGYPQSNYPYNPNTVETGNKNHFMLTGPQNSDWTVLHELGHAELFTKFTGEVEAAVNLLYVAVQNQKFGVPLETAFGRSVDGSQNENVNLAQGALTWIMTDSFRADETMSNLRMQYQQRGYGKYVEIANLFGWGALSNFWHSVNVDYTNGIDYPENTDPTDSRMLRMSQAAGVDLRPLIHFWGVLPISPNTLKTNIQNAGLPPSALIYDRLKYYQTVVPTNLAQFTAHHTAVANVVDGSVDGAWYADMLTNFTPSIGYSTISNVQEIIDLYFPTGRPFSSPIYAWSGATSANMSGSPASWGGTVPTATDIAWWNAATYLNAPTANADMTIGQLLFDAGNTGGVTFGAGSSTLTLDGITGAGIRMNSGSGAVNTGSARFALGAAQRWSNGDDSPLTVGGTIDTGGFLLTLDGVGATSLNGIISGTGGLSVANGIVTLNGANTYTGATFVTNGTLSLTGNRTVPPTTTPSFEIGGTNSPLATVNIGADLPLGGTQVRVGVNGPGTVNQTSGLVTFPVSASGNQLTVGITAGMPGLYNLSGGTLTTSLNSGGAARGVMLGVNNNSSGTLNLSGYGTLTMASGSTLQICRSDNITATNATGTFNQTGGTATVGVLRMGGDPANATLSANCKASLNLSNGTFSAAGFLMLSGGNSSASSISISGSAGVTLPAFPTGRGSGATATITFDGGALSPLAASANYMSNLTSARIKAGGATINVGSGNDITIVQPLLTDAVSIGGGLTKTGSGVLTLTGTNTYTGNTTVSNGTLVIAVASMATNSTVTVGSGAILQLNFATTNRVGALVLNGVTQSPGVYNNGNAATYVTGSGSLLVASSGPSGPATITNSVKGGVLSLSWPAGQGWRLQWQTSALLVGLGTNWVEAANTSVSSTNITIINTQPTVFYRLVYP